MEIIKEYAEDRQGHCTCIVRSVIETYDYIVVVRLYRAAKQDFPKLNLATVKICPYSGRKLGGTWGLEFPIPKECIPDSYKKVTDVPVKR